MSDHVKRMGRPSVFTADEVREIRRRVANGESQKKIAKELGVYPQRVNDVVLRKTWKDEDE